MKTNKTFILLLFSMIIFSYSSYGQGNNLSGEWKLNREKTVLAENQLFLSRVIVNLKTDSILTTRVYENGNGDEYPFEEKLSLDGKECKISIYDMPRTSKATRSAADGSVNIESTTTFSGNNGEENLVAKENWKIDSDGKTLVVAFTNKMSAGEASGTNYYNKIK
jgi:hypothetical protein